VDEKKQSASGMNTICLMQRDTSPSRRVDQAVDCGLLNVVPLLFNGCVKLLDISGNWNTLSYTLSQSIPNMLNGGHIEQLRPLKMNSYFFVAPTPIKVSHP
jgi:hypothetical protein